MTRPFLSHIAKSIALVLLPALTPALFPASAGAQRARAGLSGVARPAATPIDTSLYRALVWRNVGPFRGGRIAATTGVIGQPGVFYVGMPAGGVWKTTSAGATWFPVMDGVKESSSVGAVAVAPSDPNVVYAGMGDMATGGATNEGNGIYKSTDAGQTWQHMGLDGTRQIPSILVDVKDPNVIMVAAQGPARARSDQRGVFRSTDGGRTWTRTLYLNDSTGAQKLAHAYDVPNVVFATTDAHYAPPGVAPQAFYRATPGSGPSGTRLFKSTDNGVTWREITGGGLPGLIGRTSVAVAMHTDAQRVFLVTNTGLYRSDDGGTSWRQMDPTDDRVRNGQGGYNCGVYVDPENPDIVYVFNTAAYRSTDGGNTFTGFRGAPGGDDPQQMWIDPTNGKRILMGYDQGAIVSLDGGQSWSSWYNQSNEQVYHISTDNSYPYWIYASQQDAGAVRTRSRGNLGEITPLDWSPVPGWEWGTVVPDPLHADTVYATGNGVIRIGWPTEQWVNLSPAQDPDAHLRTAFSTPILFAPWDGHELLTGFQYLMSSSDGGIHWKRISPDVTVVREASAREPSAREPSAHEAPRSVPDAAVARNTQKPAGSATTARERAGDGLDGDEPYDVEETAMRLAPPPPSGAIETISPSTIARGTIWVGTNNGRIQVTRDGGKTWVDVSISNLPVPERADISTIDASHTDPAAAYVAVDLHTIGDYTPYFYRTHDYGKTWTRIITGLPTAQPSGSFARVIRADPVKAGLLFAGTEGGMYVSFDDGDHWDSLMLNLPITSFRDLTFNGNDMIVGTYGRGIWVLDDYAVLRQVTPAVAAGGVHLFVPGEATRVRRNVNADTPFPEYIAHAKNPPNGAVVYYYLPSKSAHAVTLDVLDASGAVIRHLSSVAPAPVTEALHPPEPNFWIAAPYAIPAEAGLNRAVWDLRYDPPHSFTHSFEINANPGETPASPLGPLVLPGTYTVRLTVDGKSYTQRVKVRNDPRETTSTAALAAQQALSLRLYAGINAAWADRDAAIAMRDAVKGSGDGSAPADVSTATAALAARLDTLAGDPGAHGFRGRGAPAALPSFVQVSEQFVRELEAQDAGDVAPTESIIASAHAACEQLSKSENALRSIASHDLPTFNATLAKHHLHAVTAEKMRAGVGCGPG
jgi:photosystem II stability/assembly factor-like uncharacterized protein